MRYAIFSDVHGNLEALEAVLADAANQRIDRFLCLGDIVGYNADPRACLEQIRALGCPVLRGNHDWETSRDESLAYFNSMAVAGVLHSRAQLDDASRAWLGALPLWLEVDGFTLVHATLAKPEDWGYILGTGDAALSFAYQRTPLAFFGHTHIPHLFVEERKGSVAEYHYRKISLDPLRRYLVNVGSVGQPRDGDSRAAYAVYDTAGKEGQALELRRLRYDIPKAQAKILKAGLPVELAERLAKAR